jgi:hypothetical protein
LEQNIDGTVFLKQNANEIKKKIDGTVVLEQNANKIKKKLTVRSFWNKTLEKTFRV